MPIEHLTQLQYSEEITGRLALYVYREDGFHAAPQYFARVMRHPEEEITAGEAHDKASTAVSRGLEVRITDSGDMLVFHAKDCKILYPPDPHAFWKACGVS